MTLHQGIEISKRAQALGYATEAKKGRVRFVTVAYGKSGRSTVTPHTGWLGYESAKEIVNG